MITQTIGTSTRMELTDQLYFIGTGGAHLYYFLRIVLSADKTVRDFPFIASDFPILPTGEELTKKNYRPNPDQTFFAVFKDANTLSIFIKLDESTYATSQKYLRRNAVHTNLLTICFKDGKTILKDFVPY